MFFFPWYFPMGFRRDFFMGCFLKSLSPTVPMSQHHSANRNKVGSAWTGSSFLYLFQLKSSNTLTPSWHFLKLQQPLFWGEHTMNPKHIFEPTHTRDHHLCHLKVSNFKFFFGSASALSQEEKRLWTGEPVGKCLVPSSHMTYVSIPEFRNCHWNSGVKDLY